MLKRLINQAIIEFNISPEDPLLVKSGRASVSGVELPFVKTLHDGTLKPYIPGSSIKGMIRSYAEKICRTLRSHPVPVCLPYLEIRHNPGPGEEDQFSCGDRLKKKKDISRATVYKVSCPACRLFGSLGFKGRLATSDAYLNGDAYSLEIRNVVAIDRFTGGSRGGALFDQEVCSRGTFKTVLEITNFERWQLGLVALVLREMQEGRVRLGFGKSRGLGKFNCTLTSFKLSYYGHPPARLVGLGGLCQDQEKEDYGFFQELDLAAPLPDSQAGGWLLRLDYDLTDNWHEILAPTVADLNAYIAAVNWPEGIKEVCREEGGQ